MSSFTDFLYSSNVVLLDGAMGTELQRRGFKTQLPLWSSRANSDVPDLVYQIHKDYVQAGADLLTTNTFRTQRYLFDKLGEGEKASELTKEAVSLALRAKNEAGRPVFVGGGLAPLEDCYDPQSVPQDDVIQKDHAYQAQLMADLGVDFIFCETNCLIREALAMCEGAKKTGLSFVVSFVTDGGVNLISGESISDAVKRVQEYGPEAIMLNCRPIHEIQDGVDELISVYGGIKGVYPNGIGKPHNDLGWKFEGENDVAQFVEECKEWHNRGVKILGGCCGAGPDYIAALYRAFC